MPNQLPKKVKQQRVHLLSQLERKLKTQYTQSLTGRQLQVLVEGRSRTDHGRMTGTSCRYLPVEFVGGEDLISNFCSVIVRCPQDNGATGEMA